jgi:hypothetical protein
MRPPSKFGANLNVFIPCWVALSLFVGGIPILIVLTVMAALRVGNPFGSGIGMAASYLVIPAILIGIWIRRGLVPAEVGPSREARYRKGHDIVALTTVAVLLAFAIPAVLAATIDSSLFSYMGLAFPVVAVAMFSWGIGLYMVWSSGA